MSLSIKWVAARSQEIEKLRETLEADKKLAWRKLAEALSAKIPESCHKFADEQEWLVPPEGAVISFYELPQWLEHLVTNTSNGGCNENKFSKDDLEIYGFKSFHDLEKGLKELVVAWDGLVRIRIAKGELPWRVTVYWYAAELEANMKTAQTAA